MLCDLAEVWPAVCRASAVAEDHIAVEAEVAEKKPVADEDPTAVEPEEEEKKTITNA